MQRTSEEGTSLNYKAQCWRTGLEALVVWQLIKDVGGSAALGLFSTAAAGAGGCTDVAGQELALATQG